MNNYRFWIRATSVFQFITAVFHTITLFVKPTPGNETEKQLYSLMDTYQFDLGLGIHRSMNELVLALSACLSLLCILSGMINFYLIKKNLAVESMKGILTIHLIVFGFFFILTVIFTFILPITQAGIILLLLLMSRLAIEKDARS